MSLCALTIGSGWGAHAANAFAQDPRVRLGGIVGRGSERTRALAAELGVPVFDDLQEAIRCLQPRIAAVAAGERWHPAIVEALLLSGCHVLCAHPVASDSDRVVGLFETARRRNLIAVADYTLRLTPAYEAACAALERSGAHLRTSIEAPGRAIVMAMDVAIGFAGPVARVLGATDYPVEIAEKRRHHPRAFPPTLLLAHRSGCVTSITPVPHAAPASAHRIALSARSARIDVALPAGEVRVVQSLGGGLHREHVERTALPATAAVETFGAPMRALARRFVDTVLGTAPPHAPLREEAHLRAVWTAAQQSSKNGGAPETVSVDLRLLDHPPS
jgi:predicted dehydrogenase